MKKYTLWDQGDTALTEHESGEYYLVTDVDAKIKEYDDDNLALSQSVSKLGARIAELEKALGFYADESNWVGKDLYSHPSQDFPYARAPSTAEEDRGAMARALMVSVTK